MPKLRMTFRLPGALAALVLGLAVHAAEPIAMLTDLQGGQVRNAGQRLAILSEIGAAAQLELTAGTRATLVHFALGRQFDLEGPGSFRIGASGVEAIGDARVTPRAPLSSAYDNVRVRPSRVVQASISMRGLRGPDQQLQLSSPAGTWVLETDPVFRWQALDGAKRYRFQLTDTSGRQLFESQTSEPIMHLPAAVVLAAGQTYAWQVSTTLPDGRAAEGWAEFGIADGERRERVLGGQPGPGAAFAERVMYALLLEDYGMHDSAHPLWQSLARERPDDANLVVLGRAR